MRHLLLASLVVAGLVLGAPAQAAPAPAAAQGQLDGVFVAIVSVDALTRTRLAGACYLIVGGSIEGCDENGDGQVDFLGVPPGNYTVTQTRAPAGYPPIADFPIAVPSGAAVTVAVALPR